MPNGDEEQRKHFARGQTTEISERPRTASQDAGSEDDYSDDAVLKRIFARYYNHFEDLGIADTERRAQLALDMGFLIGFAFRSLSETTGARSGQDDGRGTGGLG
jgi:hypothetical protein